MTTKSQKTSSLEPLQDLFEGILTRLEALELKTGCSAPFSKTPTQRLSTPKQASVRGTFGGGTPSKQPSLRGSFSREGTPKQPSQRVIHVPKSEQAAESVVEFDKWVLNTLIPFTDTCGNLGGLDDIGTHISEAFDGLRGIIILGTKSKAPDEELSTALQPHLAQTQDALKALHAVKVKRDWDRHFKAVVEFTACLSWVLMKAPQNMPANVVKDCVGSTEYWTNKIRKEFKGDDKQVAFCVNMKKALTELAAYVEKYHKTGLSWNPKGVSLAEAAVVLAELPEEQDESFVKSPIIKRRLGSQVGGNINGLMEELAKKRSGDGSSAATGLKKVSKDQQTWRKEYKGVDGEPKAEKKALVPAVPKVEKKVKPTGLPILQYQDRGSKWVIENHTKETAKKESTGGLIQIKIGDPKQQVYLYNCVGISVKVSGKFKALILDKCTKCSVVFDSVISSTEIVNSKKIQLQTTGICPAFAIDKTVGCLIWLSEESASVSTFTSSMSSEMNVSFPDGDDQKEAPLPEQFMHKIVGGKVMSEVSDLYH